jgi:hydroxymethylpyrimidine/phosphomethylpyrimidine kinase
MQPPVALTICGSDSGGGAGLQADLRTFAAHRVHGAFALTAVTAQNTTEVRAVATLDPDMVVAQVEAVVQDLEVVAVKTGMLATPEVVAAVGLLASRGLLPNLVVDPVLVSSTGHPLMDEGGVAAYRDLLLPRATVVTPNLRETARLLETDVARLADTEAMGRAATALRALGPRYVVVKGGHLDKLGGRGAPDVVAGPDGITVLEADRVATGNDHGTGCSLSAAVAANLALGAEPLDALEAAKAFVHRALQGGAAWRLGAGHGPIDHLGWSGDGAGAPAPARAGARP